MKKLTERRSISRHKILMGMVVLFIGLGLYQIDSVNWRLKVAALKLTGSLPDLYWLELTRMLYPISDFYLKPILEHRNPYAVIRDLSVTDEKIANGKRAYEIRCMHCHAEDGRGDKGPALTSTVLKNGDSQYSIYRTIKDGIAGTAMAPPDSADSEIWELVAYIMQLRASSNGLETPVLGPEISEVSYGRILAAREDPANWLTYSGTYNGWRYSSLRQVSPTTLGRLQLAWVVQTSATDVIEAGPLVVDGVMFLTVPDNAVLAIDASTGRVIWRHEVQLDTPLAVCCGRVNRGLAILNDFLYYGTLDGRLQALAAKTGKLQWENTVADSADGYTITVAPLAVAGKIVIGVSGGEFGIRGYVDAYDATSGEHVWRFNTIPASGQPGNETWAGDSWQTGGGPTWVTGSFDPELNLIYWGVGNPSPDFDGSAREGDNLYTNSIVALDSATGELRWHFQFTPHDLHDYDATQVPILIDSEDRKLLISANRNGFFYVLDRTDGTYIGSKQFSEQNWAESIDVTGRPVRSEAAIPSRTGSLVWPGSSGATNWWPPSFNPRLQLMYIPNLTRPSLFFDFEKPEERNPPDFWLGGSASPLAEASALSIVAMNPHTLSVAWETSISSSGRPFSGILGVEKLIFVGHGTQLSAFDSHSGAQLWSVELGGWAGSPPVSFRVGNTQYITISGGRNIYTFRLGAN